MTKYKNTDKIIRVGDHCTHRQSTPIMEAQYPGDTELMTSGSPELDGKYIFGCEVMAINGDNVDVKIHLIGGIQGLPSKDLFKTVTSESLCHP